ncbi:FliM/FliN family flagellar motor switch protein [Aliiruegeria lutimaris]|uniref:Flagellar motor switch protein FliM n=1 Tax=Aliiruegeria lutimaris TaxID=571298 RepID=A0A1G8WP64_9RHOB|nr:FliM/FliN family flagellar motor switch protein [Aliiruegeria lutimaris]SDJ80054.1 flagellar motor switch protein FliM [Aliiruegeria lutimaris]
MAEEAREEVLRRKVEAGRNSAPASQTVLPAKALSSALSKAAEDSFGLAVVVTSCSERIVFLADLLERLPEQGLLAVLEGPGDGQGLLSMDVEALSAIIEKQMTGAVAQAPPPSRRVTRTDAALAGRPEARWASGFGYSSHVEDLRPLGLLLEEIDCRIFGLSLDFEIGTREGQLLLALPAEGRSEALPDIAPRLSVEKPADPHWEPGLEGLVLEGEVRLEAILHRFKLPISAIPSLKVGDEIPIPLTAIDNVRLTGTEEIPLGRCRLGQSLGQRAVRLGAGESGAQHSQSGLSNLVGAGAGGSAPMAQAALPDPVGMSEDAFAAEPLSEGGLPDLGVAPMATPMDLSALQGLPDIT